jgi:hypothetical protein
VPHLLYARSFDIGVIVGPRSIPNWISSPAQLATNAERAYFHRRRVWASCCAYPTTDTVDMMSW